MKVLFAGAFPPQEKGEAHYLGRYVSEYRKHYDDCAVLSQYADRPYHDSWQGIDVQRVIRDRSAKPSYAPLKELISATTAVGPDVLHLHYGPNADYGGRLGEMLVPALRTIRRSGTRVVLTLHSLWLPDDVRGQAKKLGVPVAFSGAVVTYFKTFQRALLQSVDAMLCLVSGVDSLMTKRFGSAYDLHGLLEEVHGCEPRFQGQFAPSDDPLFFAFGFWRPDKGFDLLIEAFDRHVKEGGAGRLLIAGRPQSAADEPYARKLQELAARIDPSRCSLEQRFISDAELENKLRMAHVVVLPYLRNVGASGPLHHALGVGKPVIAADVGHNAALSDAAYLYSSHSREALQGALRCLALPSNQLSYAHRSRAAASTRSWHQLVQSNVEIYRRIHGS